MIQSHENISDNNVRYKKAGKIILILWSYLVSPILTCARFGYHYIMCLIKFEVYIIISKRNRRTNTLY